MRVHCGKMLKYVIKYVLVIEHCIWWSNLQILETVMASVREDTQAVLDYRGLNTTVTGVGLNFLEFNALSFLATPGQLLCHIKMKMLI